MKKLSKHFSYLPPDNMACKCGCGLMPDPAVGPFLEWVRMWAAEEYKGKVKVIVTSAARCWSHNEKVQAENKPNYSKGSSRSKHLPFVFPEREPYKGLDYGPNIKLPTAVDYVVKYRYGGNWRRVPPVVIHKKLNEMFPDCFGFGVYDWGNHADLRPIKKRWDRTTKK